MSYNVQPPCGSSHGKTSIIDDFSDFSHKTGSYLVLIYVIDGNSTSKISILWVRKCVPTLYSPAMKSSKLLKIHFSLRMYCYIWEYDRQDRDDFHTKLRLD